MTDQPAIAILYEGFSTWQRKVKGFMTVPPIEFFMEWEQFKQVIFEKLNKQEEGHEVQEETSSNRGKAV